MKESLKKHVICLSGQDDFERICALADAGMRVALLRADSPELDRIKQDVLAAFKKLNTPIGLMIHITGDEVPDSLEGYQYVLVQGGNIEELRKRISQLILINEPQNPEQWQHADGILTKSEEIADEARKLGKLVLFDGVDSSLGDGVLWAEGTSPETLSVNVDSQSLFQRHELTENDTDLNTINARLAVRYAEQTGAKAIMILTEDGSNVTAITSLYPPVPLIVVAKRPAGEAMLLKQTMRYGVLPTAISRVPENPLEKEKFARFVAELYGYEPGDRIVYTGHWILAENPLYIELITL